MWNRRRTLSLLLFFSALCWLAIKAGMPAAAQAGAQEPAKSAPQPAPPPQQAAPPGPIGVIRQETKVVLADVIVQDKKGGYVRDLQAKDFRVREDGKLQTITSFTSGENATPNAPEQRRYLVLFFDNSTMNMADQSRARDAAAQFIDKNASPNRLMAVIDFGGVLQLAQNFTGNTEQLKKVVAGLKFSSVTPNAPTGDVFASTSPSVMAGGGGPWLAPEQEFAVRSVLLALRRLALSLQTVPGRKTLIFFTAGFPMTPDTMPELTAAMDACNKANVAVYPLDVRGLVAPSTVGRLETPERMPSVGGSNDRVSSSYRDNSSAGGGSLQLASYSLPAGSQKGGGKVGGGNGGGGGGGGNGGGGNGGGGNGGGGGGRGGGPPGGAPPGGTNYASTINSANARQQLVPPPMPNAAPNQEVLYALAQGTGGFVILNNNDLLGGLDKIASEVNEYYILGYTPAIVGAVGSCHKIEVKMEQSGMHVRSRTGYCVSRPVDPLLGKPEGEVLESRAKGTQSGSVQFAMQAPYFYSAPGKARVNFSIECPADSFHFAKDKGKYDSQVDVLALAVRADGSIAARFSDSVKLDLEKEEWKEFTSQPFKYQNSFDIAPGNYTMKTVLSMGGDSFGKFEAPLVIEPNADKTFTVSAVAMSQQIFPISSMSTSLDAALLGGQTPLIAQGMQLIPPATNQFDHTKKTGFYIEIYDAKLLDANPPKIGIRYLVFDRKTNQQIFDSKTLVVDSLVTKGNPVITVGMWMNTDELPPGQYRLDINAGDGANQRGPTRSVNFELK